MHAQLLQLARNRKALRLRLEDESGDAATSGLGARFGVEDYHIGNGAVSNEHFGAVDEVAASYRTRCGADTHSVGARIRRWESQRADHLGAGEARQVFPLLFSGTVAQDVVNTQVTLRNRIIHFSSSTKRYQAHISTPDFYHSTTRKESVHMLHRHTVK